MASDWIKTTVGAQATLQRGIDITKAEQRDGIVPVISSGGISSYHDEAAAKGPGVVLGRKGVVGSVYFVESDYWPHDTTLWVKDFHGNDPRFVYFFFRWMAPRIATMDVGSSNPTLNRNHVHPIEIWWPLITDQCAIARILGALDDKIELNRRMNETSEAIARSMFKSWFVNFDAVRAKADRRDPKLPKRIADLVPNSFEDSDLGEIPKGWTVRGLDEIARFLNGLALQKYPPKEGRTLPVIKIAQLRIGSSDGADLADADLASDYIIEDGEVLFSWSGSLECVLWAGGRGALNNICSKLLLINILSGSIICGFISISKNFDTSLPVKPQRWDIFKDTIFLMRRWCFHWSGCLMRLMKYLLPSSKHFGVVVFNRALLPVSATHCCLSSFLASCA